jgi:hypothetical protein
VQQARDTHIQRPKLKKITVLAAFALWQDRGSEDSEDVEDVARQYFVFSILVHVASCL